MGGKRKVKNHQHIEKASTGNSERYKIKER